METVTKPAQGLRSADKVLEALATLAALLDRTINEVKSIDGDFQDRLMQAVHDTEASLQAQTAEHVERARHEVEDALNTKFQNDLQSALNDLKGEFETERARFDKELKHAVDAAAQLESERSGLIAEVQRAKDEAKAAAEKAPAAAPSAVGPSASLQDEMTKVEARLQDVLKIIDDPATELSTVIRKNVEKSELEAYLRGMRYALNGSK
jgi:chromosome segregation ATPase